MKKRRVVAGTSGMTKRRFRQKLRKADIGTVTDAFLSGIIDIAEAKKLTKRQVREACLAEAKARESNLLPS